MEDILLCVSAPPEIELEIFLLWVEGKTLEEAIALQSKKAIVSIDSSHGGSPSGGNLFNPSSPFLNDSSNPTLKQTNQVVYGLEFRRPTDNKKHLSDLREIVKSEVADQYRAFQILEHFLSYPTLLKSQSLCIINDEILPVLVEKYWALDDIFLREMLYKRITKSRKDLEEVSENTGLNLRKVTRQFDNVKRVLAAYEEGHEDNIFSFIVVNFLLSHQLARRYACISFLLLSKFNLQSKRRLLKASCESLELCAALILALLAIESSSFFKLIPQESTPEQLLLENNGSSWTCVWTVFPMVNTTDLDKQVLVNLRDLKAALTGELLDSGCLAVKNKLGKSIVKKLDGNTNSKVRTILKSLLQIGANLSQSREYRDLFEDILSKVAEPLEESGLTMAEISFFLSSSYYLVHDIPEISRLSTIKDQVSSASSRSMDSTSASSVSNLSKLTSRVFAIKKDWMRFVAFARLCVLQLIEKRSA